MKAYLFFNNDNIEVAPKVSWGKHQNHDALRLALFCAEGWADRGWTVDFVRAPDLGFPEEILGRLQSEYPAKYFNIWFALEKLAPCFFFTYDVRNNGFIPIHLESLVYKAANGGYSAISFQELGGMGAFSAAAMYVTKEYCEAAIERIADYALGRYPPIDKIELVSDESILRHYGPKVLHDTSMTYYQSSGWHAAKMVHYGRSTLQWFNFQTIPAKC